MKNRFLCRMTGFGMTVLMLTGMMNICLSGTAFGAEPGQQDEKLKMVSAAVWTDEENYRAELTVEITGLKAWVDSYKNGKNDNKEMISDEVQLTPRPAFDEDAFGKKTDEEAEAKEKEERGIDKKTEAEETAEGEPGTEEPVEEEPDAEESEPESVEREESESAVKSSDLCVNITEMRVTADASQFEKHIVTAVTVSDDLRETSDMTAGNNMEIVLEAWISKYFSVPEEELSKGCSSRILIFPGEGGEPEAGAEVTCVFTDEELGKDSCTVTIPLILKEEYRYCESARLLEVLVRSSTAEQQSFDDGKAGGIVLSMLENGQRIILLTDESGVVLEASETPADFALSIKTDSENPRPGQTLSYLVSITNTGRQPLPLISLESSISSSDLNYTWLSDGSLETDVTGKRAVLTDLYTGEIRQITCQVKIPEDRSESIVNRITASAQKTSDPGTTIVRDATLKTPVTPLKVDFSVSKSADRTKAGPGDTIIYQICIRNTGERTLHSVLSTERFQTENIRAQFVEKEGVLLNTDKTQALITEIPPGEVFSLDAVATLPEDLKSGELLNQVLVKTRETGNKIVQSTASVQIVNISPTSSPEDVSSAEQSGDGDNTGNGGFAASDSPKTSDDSNPAFWLIMLGTAFFASAGAWGYHQFRKKQ